LIKLPHNEKNSSLNGVRMEGALPLDGVRVVEMSHMIMGPSAGMFLGFLGAEVIKVEPRELP